MIGIVYKISNSIDDRLYVGSTFRSINERYYEHKSDSRCENRKNHTRPLYVAMRELGEDKFRIEVIETVECKNKDELHTYEQKHIDELKPIFNYQRAYNTEETRKACKKAWYNNKRANMTEADKKAETLRVKEWATKNPEKSKASHKARYERNKEEISAKYKEIYQNNKAEKIAKSKNYYETVVKKQVSIVCDVCGGKYKPRSKTKHFNTNLHKSSITPEAITTE